MSEPRRGVAVEIRDANPPPSGFPVAFWRWLRRDFILRRVSLLLSGGCLVFVFAYLTIHVIMLAPVLLLAVLAFLYGVSGRRPGGP